MIQKLQEIRDNKKQGDGFTIIEVMIVLAIAGLILVVVLVAIPQLQANQRDSSRENVVSRVSTELGNYASNNNGVLPFDDTRIADFTARYITDEIDVANPSTGNNYALVFADDDSSNPSADQILIHRGATCTGESATGTVSTTTTRQYALRVALDAGDIYFCIDNS